MPILINDNTARVQYTATSGQTVFAVPFEFFENSDLEVYRNGTLQTITAQYTLTGAGVTGGGNLTFVSGVTLNDIITIVRDVPIQRVSDFPLSGPFNIEALNTTLDKMTAMMQQIETSVATRALILSDTDLPTSLNKIPSKDTRALKLLGFDSAGNPTALAPADGSAASLATSLSLTSGANSIGYGSNVTYSAGTVGNELVPRVTIALLPSVSPVAGKVAFIQDAGREGHFVCQAGTAPADAQQGIYVASSTPNFYWERVWDGINGYPEWFGAVVNSNSGSIPTNNLTALQACVALCPVTNLQAADYWISGTWKIQTQYRTVRGGVVSDGYNTGTGTRLLSVNAAANVIQVGPDSAPAGGTSNYFRNITVENICARWGVALTPPSSGNESTAVKGWLVNYLLNCKFKNCAAWEPIIGFYMYGTVYTKFDDCSVFRSNSYGGSNDFFRGFWAQGAPPILAGANPSLYINRCNVGIGGAPALISPTGVFINANFSDIFVDDLETSAVANGLIVDGSGAASGASKIDLHIRNSVMDQCNGNGIRINALNAMAMVTINGGYVQVNDTGASVNGIYIHGSVNEGSVSIGGGIQIISSVGTTNRGIYISQQSNVKVDSTVIIEDFYNPVVIDGGSERCDIRATINNPNTGNGGSAAVTINSAVECHIAPSVDGAATKFAQGVFSVGTALNRATINPTMFNSAAISGGAANKVQINSVQITAPGYYTTAGAGGTSGAGIFVTGITA